MLPRQDFGWHHEGALRARFDRGRQRQQRHNGLARSHIALQQSQHALGCRHVAQDFRLSALLCEVVSL